MSDATYPDDSPSSRGSVIREAEIESEFIAKLDCLKYVIRRDIRQATASYVHAYREMWDSEESLIQEATS